MWKPQKYEHWQFKVKIRILFMEKTHKQLHSDKWSLSQ
jgi:hypothetical protein